MNTFTYKSPARLPCGEIPSPLILKVFPLGVPGGILSVTTLDNVGILILAPSAASVKSRGTSKIRSLFFLLKNLWGDTPTCTNRSPSGAPGPPEPPLPLKRITVPLSTPAGIFTLIDSFSITEPAPLHDLHCLSITLPCPLHAEQV